MGRNHQRRVPRTAPPIVGPPSDKPAYSDDGVDLTLIRWMLRLTPAERLAVLSSHAQGLDALKNARAKG